MKKTLAPFIILLALSGCRGFNPIPAWNRSGEFYSLTDNYNWYDLNGRDFCGFGKAMVQRGWMDMVPIPRPSLFLGFPIYLVEKYALCPVIDTLMLPRDIYIRKSLCDEVTTGVLLELKDYWGRPATNISFGLRAVPDSDPGKKVFYDGRRENSVLLARRTDAQGQYWFPLAPSTCEYIDFNVSAWTREGHFFGRKAENESTPHHWIVRLVPESSFNPRQPDAPLLQLPSNVFVISECMRGELMLIENDTPENCALDNYYKKCNMPERPADFDAYWDGERARLDREVPFAARLSPVDTDRLDGLDAFAVEFPSFGRDVYGFMTRPKAGDQKYPVHILVSSEDREFSIENLVADSNAVTLAINALPRAWSTPYDCVNHGNNGVNGINKSREDYFYHPVVLGAARGIAWLLDQPYADAARSQIAGIGQGGGLGLWLMAFEPRIARGIFIEPSHLNQLNTNGPWPSLMNGTRQEVERFRAKARPNIPYFDTFNFAPRVTRPVVLATGDEYKSPCRDVFALFRALPENPDNRLYFCPKMARTNMLSRVMSQQRQTGLQQ
ncbi:MAG: acetylxylan esterase [Kiritimatiellae bacterium]|nr:acetylxylan esterase [Kiritimatiellia bacterium]